MDTKAKILASLIDRRGSRRSFAEKIGIPPTTLQSMLTNGVGGASVNTVIKICKELGITVEDLESFAEKVERGVSIESLFEKRVGVPVVGKSTEVPLYGSIAAGVPLEMVKVEEYVEIPENIAHRHPNAFLLRVNGDSMDKVIPNGMYALIDPDQQPKNGDIVAITLNGCDATLKRFFRNRNTITLEPDSHNPEHRAITLDCTKGECEDLRVLGKMVWFMAPLDMKF